MDITELLAYSGRCWKLMQATLLATPDLVNQPFETTSRFNTIAKLVAHTIGAELRWQARIVGVPPEMYEVNPAETIEGLFADASTTREKTYAILASLEEGGVARPIAMRLGDFETVLTVEQILFQVLNHENYHRGQISMALQHFGADPPNFDYCLLYRD